MARKGKRRPARRSTRQPVAPKSPPGGGIARATPSAARGGEQTLVRAVEMSLGPRTTTRRGGRVVLDSADPAIPIDRVPYFTSDLKRLGIVGAAMVVLLVAGAQLIPLVVK